MAQSKKKKSAKKATRTNQVVRQTNKTTSNNIPESKGVLSKPLAIFAIIVLIVLPLVAYYLINSYYTKNKVTYNELYTCNKCAFVNEPLISPDGNYKLHVEYKATNGSLWYFVPYVYDLNTDEILLAGAAYENTHKVAFIWDESSRLWGYTDNLGFFYYENVDNSWELVKYQADNSGGLVLPLSFQDIETE